MECLVGLDSLLFKNFKTFCVNFGDCIGRAITCAKNRIKNTTFSETFGAEDSRMIDYSGLNLILNIY